MVISDILEVAIGVIFIYTLLSVICSAVREGIEAWLKTRAAYLEHGIRMLLNDPDGKGLAAFFYNHPLIDSLYTGRYKPSEGRAKPNSVFAGSSSLPSYIPSGTFARTLMDLAARGPQTTPFNSAAGSRIISLDTIRANVATLQNAPVQRALLAALDAAQGDLEKAQKNIESWFDSAMDRVSGWYRRSTQWIIFWIALFVAVGLNVNTIRIADYLYRNDSVRATLVERAKVAAAKDMPNNTYAQARKDLDALTLPIGWPKGEWRSRTGVSNGTVGEWAMAAIGWLLTAIAATLGGPFWFDMLNKVMVIRSTVKPFEKSPNEASEDRQKNNAPTISVNTMSTGTTSSLPPPSKSPAAPQPEDHDEHNVDATDIDLAAVPPTTDDQLPK